MDTVNSTTTPDTSGNGYTGTLYGVTSIINGKFTQAANFNGSSDYIGTGLPYTLIPPNITISAWFKANTIKDAGIVSSYWWSYWGTVRLRSTGNVEWYWYDASTVAHSIASTTGSVITTGGWYHVTATFDKASTTATLYLNGQSVGTTTSPNIERGGVANPLIGIHQQADLTTFAFNGLIDDVRIYNRALSASEISALYNNNNGCIPQ